jgi:hypothetical protein
MSHIGADDLVYTNKDGIYSGGFNVQSIIMKGGMSPIMTININNDGQKGGSTGKVSDMFSGLVVPAYAYYHNGGSKSKSSSYKSHNSDNDESDSEDDVIDDDLHDKLLGLVREHDNKLKQEERKKKRTRKHTKSKKANTRKHLRKAEDSIDVKQ